MHLALNIWKGEGNVHKSTANECKSLALQNQTSQENDWLGDNWKAQISERSPGIEYLIGQSVWFTNNLSQGKIIPSIRETASDDFFYFFQDLFWKLYGIFSEKYSQRYAVD